MGLPMVRLLSAGIQGILLGGIIIVTGCEKSPAVPLNLNNLDPSQDQQFIIDQYVRQAALMKQKAEEMRVRADRYAQLFGPDSEWTISAKLLREFYEKEAQDRERLAILHAEIGKSRHDPGHSDTR